MNFEIGDLSKAGIYAFLITSSFSSVYPRGGGFTGFVKKTDKLKLMVLINKLEKTSIPKGYRIYPSLTVRILKEL
jgi:hypothetical protein